MTNSERQNDHISNNKELSLTKNKTLAKLLESMRNEINSKQDSFVPEFVCVNNNNNASLNNTNEPLKFCGDQEDFHFFSNVMFLSRLNVYLPVFCLKILQNSSLAS